MKRIGALGVCLVVASSLLPAHARATGPQDPDRSRPAGSNARLDPTGAGGRVPGEIVVSYRPSASRTDRGELRDAAGARVVSPLALARTEVVSVARGEVDKAIAALESSPDVAFAEPNYYVRTSALPNDPRLDQLWGLENTGQSVSGFAGTADADIDAPEAWEITKGSHAVTVAIVDTGVAFDHPDLAANMWTNPGETGSGKATNGTDDDRNGFKDDWRGWDWIGSDNTPRDFFGHGTHVAGIVGATGNDSYGGVGVNWSVSLMPLRVLDSEGVGTTADVAAAIAYAAANGADIVNLSLGGPDFSLAVQTAIGNAPGVLVVAAAGNEASNNDVTGSYPCNYPLTNIVCVAASDSLDQLAGYSNYGAASVDLAAPGSRILSTVPAFTRALRETFEADISSTWVIGGTGTQWSRGLDEFGYYAADSVDSDYVANTDSWLQTGDPVNLAGQENCTLSYVFELDTEQNADAFEIEVSANRTAWSPVGGWTGSTGGDWLTATHDISDHDGTSIYLRFRLISNALLNAGGVSIDDVQVKCLSSNFMGTEFAYFSGTSMAAPYVAGAAALVLAAAPATTIASLRSALVTGVDQVSSLTGKVATGGRLNVAKALDAVVPEVVPTADPSPSSSATADPSPDPSPSPTATDIVPEPEPTADPLAPRARSITLNLRKHLVARGRVSVADDLSSCLANITVLIKRWGKVVRSIQTAADGTYRIRIPDRPGRYVAAIPAVEEPTAACAAARSRKIRHRHHD